MFSKKYLVKAEVGPKPVKKNYYNLIGTDIGYGLGSSGIDGNLIGADRSPLGNVNFNDYREPRVYNYTTVEDLDRVAYGNEFAERSLAENTLRKIVTGVAASTGLQTKEVTSRMNMQTYDGTNDPRTKKADTTVRDLGKVEGSDPGSSKDIDFLGNVED